MACSSSRSSRARSDLDRAVAGHPQGQLLVVPGGAGQHPRRRVEFGGSGEPEPDVGAGDLALELLGGALGDQAALVEHRDPVGELVGLLQVLGGEEDGGAVGHQLADDPPHRAPAARVETRRRLVQEDDPRAADQRHRQVQLPAHAAGVGRHQLVAPTPPGRTAPAGPRDHPASPERRRLRSAISCRFSRPGQQLVHRRELAGDADGRAHLPGLGRHVVPGRRAPSRRRPSSMSSGRSPSSSCPPRSGRAWRRPFPPRHRSRCRRARPCRRMPCAALRPRSPNFLMPPPSAAGLTRP